MNPPLPNSLGRRAKAGLNVGVQVFAAAWIVLIANGWLFYYTYRVDISSDESLTLSEDVERTLEGIDQRIETFVPHLLGDNARDRVRLRLAGRAERVLEEFASRNPNFQAGPSFSIARRPDLWSEVKVEHGVELVNRVYLVSSGRVETVPLDDLAAVRETRQGVRSDADLYTDLTIETLATAIQRLLRPEPPKIIFTQGSREPSVLRLGAWVEDLKQLGYDVGGIDLRTSDAALPKDAILIVVAHRGDFETFTEEFAARIDAHIEAGGRLMLFTPQTGPTGLEPLLSEIGVTVMPGRLASYRTELGETFVSDELSLERMIPHPVTDGFTGRQTVLGETFVLDWHRSRAFDFAEGAVAQPVAGIGQRKGPIKTWLEDDGELRFDEDDLFGEWCVFATAELDNGARIVLNGSSETALQLYRGDVRALLLNSVDWLAGAPKITRGGRPVRVELIPLDSNLWRNLQIFAFLILPGIPVVAGILVAWLRRTR